MLYNHLLKFLILENFGTKKFDFDLYASIYGKLVGANHCYYFKNAMLYRKCMLKQYVATSTKNRSSFVKKERFDSNRIENRFAFKLKSFKVFGLLLMLLLVLLLLLLRLLSLLLH